MTTTLVESEWNGDGLCPMRAWYIYSPIEIFDFPPSPFNLFFYSLKKKRVGIILTY